MRGRDWRRLGQIAGGGARALLLPLLTPMIALLTIRVGGTELWGQLIASLVVGQLAAQLIGWGQKEYLLRAFSQQPAQIGALWWGNWRARGPLWAVVAAAALLAAPTQTTLLIVGYAGLLAIEQSFAPLVSYRREFSRAAAIEASGVFFVLGAIWLNQHALSSHGLLACYCLASGWVSLVYGWRYRKILGGWPKGSFAKGHLRRGLPFFILSLSGLLQSRVDLYVVSRLLRSEVLASYQILTRLLIYLQVAGAVALEPYLRTLYRAKETTARRLGWRFALFGALLLGPGLLAIERVLAWLYQLPATPLQLLIGGGNVLAVLIAMPRIQMLLRAGKTYRVGAFCLVGAGVNLSLSLWFIPIWGTTGALAASGVAQWLIAALVGWASRARQNIR